MRRAFSISVIVALVCSLFAPAFAATCESMNKKPVCHRQNGVVHHCDTMGHHHQAEVASESSASVTAASNTSDCPMACCNQAYFITAIAGPARFVSPVQVVMNHEFHFSTVIFVSTGFSSHTDRGPPLA